MRNSLKLSFEYQNIFKTIDMTYFLINFDCLYKLSGDNNIINKHKKKRRIYKFWRFFFFLLMSWIKDNCIEKQSHITT